MQRLGTYLPKDRLRALAKGEPLPSQTQGSAIFADSSGFTPLTERLTKVLGLRKGVEALSHQLNAVYGALIDQIEMYGGSIISFAGDSIIGWFAEANYPAPFRAVRCAHGMQTAMQSFGELSLKVIIATGPARRLVVGDPGIQQLDTLAGRMIARLTIGERVIQRSRLFEISVGSGAFMIDSEKYDHNHEVENV